METNLAYAYEDVREELIGGRVVAMASPSIAHERVSGNIYRIFSNFLFGRPCEPFKDGAEVRLTEEDHFIPDMMVVCDPDKIKGRWVEGAPDLVVEVRSPSTAKRDVGYKKDLYERCGVREYWIVDPVHKSVEQYVLDAGRFVLRELLNVWTEAYQRDVMTEEERAEIRTSFPCGIFPDLTVRLEDVFYRL